MKKYSNNKALRQSVLSFLAMGIFILIGIGSIINNHFFPSEIYKEYKGRGIYEEKVYLLNGGCKTYTGELDSEGRYHGHYTIKSGGIYSGTYKQEKTLFINGLRHGKSDYFNSAGKLTHSQYYNMGVKVGLISKSTTETGAAASAYEVLQDRYPWLSHELNAFGFEDAYVEAYLDTVELLLDEYALSDEYFNDYMNAVNSKLEETPYDSLIVLNKSISTHLGIQEMKNSELRLAVLTRFKSNGNTTYNIVNNTFPGYLLSINEESVENADFEVFCHVLDSCMDSKGVLDLEDPFFIDSVDLWFSESLILIYESEDYGLKTSHSNANPQEVANAALSLMYQRFKMGDVLKRSAREAYILNKGSIRLPVVTTVSARNISPRSVELVGYILENGGAEITTSGISWASHYNPTVEDQSVPSQTRTGGFTATIEGLTEGNTYYARSYATNSAGNAYGNCISFVATAPTGIEEHEFAKYNFSIYPNPASTVATFSFFLESPERVLISITDISGRLVYTHDPGKLFQHKSQIQLDLSFLPNGLYTCQMIKNGAAIANKNMIIIH